MAVCAELQCRSKGNETFGSCEFIIATCLPLCQIHGIAVLRPSTMQK